jgi:acyl-CoA thioester hydrolase
MHGVLFVWSVIIGFRSREKVFELIVQPRFYETDAFGHVNNTVFAGWFETAREPIFRMFSPDLNVTQMSLILARIEIDFVAQTHYGEPVLIKTWIAKIGHRSFVVMHEAWQQQRCVARGQAVQVSFDFEQQQSIPVPDDIRQALSAHLPDQT